MSDAEACEVLIVSGGRAGKRLAADMARAGHDVVLTRTIDVQPWDGGTR